jgi:hypothetical protein
LLWLALGPGLVGTELDSCLLPQKTEVLGVNEVSSKFKALFSRSELQ